MFRFREIGREMERIETGFDKPNINSSICYVDGPNIDPNAPTLTKRREVEEELSEKEEYKAFLRYAGEEYMYMCIEKVPVKEVKFSFFKEINSTNPWISKTLNKFVGTDYILVDELVKAIKEKNLDPVMVLEKLVEIDSDWSEALEAVKLYTM